MFEMRPAISARALFLGIVALLVLFLLGLALFSGMDWSYSLGGDDERETSREE